MGSYAYTCAPCFAAQSAKNTNVGPNIKDDIARRNRNAFLEIKFVYQNLIQNQTGLISLRQ